jgi:hypothetical protein
VLFEVKVSDSKTLKTEASTYYQIGDCQKKNANSLLTNKDLRYVKQEHITEVHK